jgi:YbbR domain-containing protein
MKIPKIFTHNLPLKIISLVTALILWASYGRISGEKTITHIDVAPTFSNLPSGYEIVTQDIGSIRLRIQGSTNTLKRITNEDFSVNIDLSSINQPSEMDIVVLPLLQYPSNLEILEVNPVSLEVFVDKTISANIPLYVDPENISNIPPGVRISDIKIIPPAITIEGPQSEISMVESIGIKPLSLPKSSQVESIMVNGQLDLPTRSPIRWKSETRRVGIQIFFEDIIEKREIRRIQLRVLPRGIECTLSQSFIDALVTGPLNLLERMQTEDYFAVIDLSGLDFKKNEKRDVTPRLQEEDKLSEISINPKQITVTFNESLQEYQSRMQTP